MSSLVTRSLLMWITLAALTGLSAFSALAQEPEETFGCEANPTGDPIGGGEGYRNVLTSGDFIVRTTEELIEALGNAKPGQVVFVPGGVEIDVTEHDGISLNAGVILAGDRGLAGSPGARIFTTRKSCHAFYTKGDNVRLTGLRFEGPEGGAGRVADSAYFLSIGHYNVEVDNCEIYNFNVVGIGVNSTAMKVNVHHNYIHHCQRGGLGYGISTSSSDLHIIANKFEYCRHHIASSGTPGSGYEAAWNLVLANATSHHFDMHGGRDRGDNTNIAGDWMHVHHNTFIGKHRHVAIRGVPSAGAEIHHNWFSGPTKDRISSGGNTRVWRNVYGPDKILEDPEG